MALRQGRKWRDEGLDLTIAVNLSTRNLLDRSFVMRMSEEHDDVAIVRSTIDLGRNLGLDVVAEGVETREIWEKLQELGCQTAQGYYLSRPVPADMLTEWLRERSRVAVATAAAGA